MNIRLISHQTPAYKEMLRLRLEVLLQPIGLDEHYIDQAAEKNDLLIAAFDRERMVGCCVLTARPETKVQLRQMAVRPDVQGTKVGARILQFAEGLARSKGYATVFMHARAPVIPFYEKCGYAAVGSMFDEVGMPHLKMEKQLAEST